MEDHKSQVYSMKETFDRFNAMREGVDDTATWDMVVLTTADQAQKEAFDIQIQSKLDRNEIPSCCQYLIIADPPGPRVGSGGATMHVLAQIAATVAHWDTKKILIAHTGGQSMRLPLSSALGKIFTRLPVGPTPQYDALEVVLASFLPFANQMGPGVFIACSDILISHDLSKLNKDCKFDEGFVALAHPASTKIGKDHGVYIVDPKFYNATEPILCECLKVLQKPSEEEMIANRALISQHPENMVLTDSSFYFDHNVSKLLINLYEEISPLQAEICAFGDFLQPLGKYSSDNYIPAGMSPSSVIKRQLYNLFSEIPFKTLVIPKSRFYHIGTLPEYTGMLCDCEDFLKDMNINRQATLRLVPISHPEPSVESPNHVLGCVMSSVLHNSSIVPSSAILEYSRFTNGIEMGEGAVVSNCSSSKKVVIPPGMFLHTIAVKVADISGFVTCAFHVNDNLKQKIVLNNTPKSFLKFLGQSISLKHLTSCLGKKDTVSVFSDEKTTLWHLKAFKVCISEEEALHTTLSLVQDLCSVENGTNADLNGYSHNECNGSCRVQDEDTGSQKLCHVRFSVYDAMANKDVHKMLALRLAADTY